MEELLYAILPCGCLAGFVCGVIIVSAVMLSGNVDQLKWRNKP